MGWNIPGHGKCLVCHPDLVKGWAKTNGKGLKRLRHSVAQEMQESERFLDLLIRAKEETDMYEDD